MIMKTAELKGASLDWAVTKCEGLPLTLMNFNDSKGYQVRFGIPLIHYTPSTNWAQGGPIIEREKIQPSPQLAGEHTGKWRANCWRENKSGALLPNTMYGKTPLEAAMRCYVASKLGDEIKVPNELVNKCSEVKSSTT